MHTGWTCCEYFVCTELRTLPVTTARLVGVLPRYTVIIIKIRSKGKDEGTGKESEGKVRLRGKERRNGVIKMNPE